jgi:ADP-heptose:LPS heptosyltransferase
MKILLWKAGALGDVLMTTPLIRQLRKALAGAQIDYLTGHGCVPLLSGNAHIDHVIGFDAGILYNARAARLGTVLRLLRGYDAIFVLDKHWIFSLLAWASRVPLRVGFARRPHEGLLHTHRVSYGALRHEIDYYLDLAAAFGVPIDRSDLKLELPQAAPFPLPQPYVVLVNSGGTNIGERSDVRKMPDALFQSLVGRCVGQGAKVVFLGTREERPQYEKLAGDATINLCGGTTLQQAWFVLEHAQAVYTTDCGLMHMAGAVNARLTAIFGPTHPARKSPPDARCAWTDEDLYDSDYEIFGKVPRNRQFFRRMTIADVLQGARSQAESLRSARLRRGTGA